MSLAGRTLLALLVILIGSLCEAIEVEAQSTTLPNAEAEAALRRAEGYLVSFKNDSTLALTSRLLTKLKAQRKVDTPFGIRVQLAEATALEMDLQGEQALQKALHVQQLSQAHAQWEVHAKVSLVLALTYERIGLRDQSRYQLSLAKADIAQHYLPHLFPSFAIRRASWERLYGKHGTALSFARQALAEAVKHRLLLEEAISHMLLNGLLPKSAVAERLRHCQQAVRLYQQLDDCTGQSAMYRGISRIHLQRTQYDQALAYSDSALLAARRAINRGDPKTSELASIYQLRSQIYQQTRQLDSALTNLQKGYELDQAVEADHHKIIDLETRYQRHLHYKQLAQQQLTIQLKSNQFRFTLIISLLVTLLAIGFGVGYSQQRKSKRQLIGQNKLIQRQAQRLQSLDMAKSHFFANVAHELRTPLTLLLNPVKRLIAANKLGHQDVRLLQLAQHSGQQLEQLITDILELGKLDLSKIQVEKTPTRLVRFFGAHLAQFDSLAQSRRIAYTRHIDVHPTRVVDLDQAKCRQIVNNLLTNAFKFTPPGQQIISTLRLTGGWLHIRVTDTGSGIHPDDLPHLFDRYFQTTRPEKPIQGGTGIGLALCHEYVQLMGGTIDVTSTLGKGSTFDVTLPVTLPAPTDHLPDDTASAEVSHLISFGPDLTADQTATGGNGVKPKLLLVEDNVELRGYLQVVLSDSYHVITASHGQEALDYLQAKRSGEVALIVSDLMMPVMDGYQLLKALKVNDATRHIPVVMLTARADLSNKLQSLRVGVDDYITKPFEETELLARLANLLKNQLVRRQVLATEVISSDPKQPILSQVDQQWLEKFEYYAQQRLADPLLSVAQLAHDFFMSESSLLRQVKRLTGLSTQQYLQAIRLEEARQLLESRSGMSIAQIATRTGYVDVRSFRRSFTARFGKAPSKMQ